MCCPSSGFLFFSGHKRLSGKGRHRTPRFLHISNCLCVGCCLFGGARDPPAMSGHESGSSPRAARLTVGTLGRGGELETARATCITLSSPPFGGAREPVFQGPLLPIPLRRRVLELRAGHSGPRHDGTVVAIRARTYRVRIAMPTSSCFLAQPVTTARTFDRDPLSRHGAHAHVRALGTTNALRPLLCVQRGWCGPSVMRQGNTRGSQGTHQ